METNNQKNDQNIIPNDAVKPQKGVNVPNLRFRQFQNIWIKKSLHDITKKINIKNKNKECKNVICNSAQLGLIRQIDFFDKEIAQDGSIENYTIIKKNDFVYNPRKSLNAPYGPVNIYNYEEAGIVSPLYLCFSVHDIDKIFLHYYFKSQAWYRLIYLNGDSGARHDRVSIKDEVFFSQNLYLPNAIEQEKIGVFLTLIDQRIDAQSKIIEKYESLIKTISNKLFFNITNRVKLSEICSITTGKLDANQMDENGIYPFFTCGKETLKINKYAFDCEAILISGNGDIGRTKYYNGKFNAYQRTYILYNFKGSPIFIKYAIDYALPKKVKEETQISAMPYIKLGTLSELSIPYPDIHIQIEDVQILNTLQTKINVEKDILEKLKEQKKYLLSNMFI